MYGVVVQRGLGVLRIVATFPHLEDAHKWAEDTFVKRAGIHIPYLWHVTEVESPDKFVP